MKAQIKNNPTRVRVPKYGNGLMLFMEYASNYPSNIVRNIIQLDDYFDIQVGMTSPSAQSIKTYINNNL